MMSSPLKLRTARSPVVGSTAQAPLAPLNVLIGDLPPCAYSNISSLPEAHQSPLLADAHATVPPPVSVPTSFPLG